MGSGQGENDCNSLCKCVKLSGKMAKSLIILFAVCAFPYNGEIVVHINTGDKI